MGVDGGPSSGGKPELIVCLMAKVQIEGERGVKCLN